MFAKLPPPARIDSEIIVHHNILRGFLVFIIIKMTICVRKTTLYWKNYSFHKLLSQLCIL